MKSDKPTLDRQRVGEALGRVLVADLKRNPIKDAPTSAAAAKEVLEQHPEEWGSKVGRTARRLLDAQAAKLQRELLALKAKKRKARR